MNVRNADQVELVALLPIRMLDGASTWKVLEERARPELFMSPGNDPPRGRTRARHAEARGA